MRRVLGEGEGGESQEDAGVEGGGREPDAAGILASTLELQLQVQGIAGQAA